MHTDIQQHSNINTPSPGTTSTVHTDIQQHSNINKIKSIPPPPKNSTQSGTTSTVSSVARANRIAWSHGGLISSMKPNQQTAVPCSQSPMHTWLLSPGRERNHANLPRLSPQRDDGGNSLDTPNEVTGRLTDTAGPSQRVLLAFHSSQFKMVPIYALRKTHLRFTLSRNFCTHGFLFQ